MIGMQIADWSVDAESESIQNWNNKNQVICTFAPELRLIAEAMLLVKFVSNFDRH